jgi:crotonobetainyl-CoA:carnitine CoA-transferase CaiB-like acyl-CoA transferase
MPGLMAKTGFPDGPPTKVGATVGDQVPAIYAALGVVAALRQRDRDGRGQKVDVAMLDALVSLLGRPLGRVRAGRARGRQRRPARRSARVFPPAMAAAGRFGPAQWERRA